MSKKWKLTRLILIGAAWTWAAVSLAQPPGSAFRAATSELATAPVPAGNLRIIEAAGADGTMRYITQPGTVIEHIEFRGWMGPVAGGNGRCVVMDGAHGSTINDVRFVHGDDDSLGLAGNFSATVVNRCEFPVHDWRNGFAHALLADTRGIIYGKAAGNALNVYRSDFGGGAVRLSGGVYEFTDCPFTVGALYGIECQENTKINLIRPRFRTIPQPKDAGYWYHEIGPCPIRVANGFQSRLYIVGATLDGVPIEGRALCRRLATAADRLAGRPAYGLPNSVPTSVFVKEPLSK